MIFDLLKELCVKLAAPAALFLALFDTSAILIFLFVLVVCW